MYVLTEGEYSDWYIVGYVKTKKEADILALKNDYHCEEVNLLFLSEEESKKKYRKYYKVEFFFGNSEVNPYSKCVGYEPFNGGKKNIKYKYYQWGHIVYVDTTSEEKALKIARDYMAKKKAKEAGI